MISKLSQRLFLLLALLIGVQSSHAFSLVGARGPWHVVRIGYPDAMLFYPVDLGEEYRWNVPQIYYAVTPEFLQFFGARGEEAIEQAMKSLSSLPAMSKVNVNDYPLNTTRANYRARALRLLDLKSAAMSSVLEQMGLGDPVSFVYTLRARWTPNGTATNFVVIKRNFDPITSEPSSYINGELYTYTSIFDGQDSSTVGVTAVDPLSRNLPVTTFALGAGYFYTGLTRDDVGGLKYIYGYNNVNYEVATNAFSALGVPGLVTPSSSGGGASGNQWGVANFPTNTTTTGGTTDPNAAVTNTVATNAFIVSGLRPGVDKFSFIRVYFDNYLGGYATTNFGYVDRVMVGTRLVTQSLGRTLTAPDISFHAGDMGGGATDDPPGLGYVWRNSTMASFATANNAAGTPTSTAGTELGPGTINNGVFITFNKLMPYFFNGSYPNNLSEVSGGASLVWGSFDGSTNAPIVYPSGTSIEEIERRVLGGGR